VFLGVATASSKGLLRLRFSMRLRPFANPLALAAGDLALEARDTVGGKAARLRFACDASAGGLEPRAAQAVFAG
jgi:hypothetical protein